MKKINEYDLYIMFKNEKVDGKKNILLDVTVNEKDFEGYFTKFDISASDIRSKTVMIFDENVTKCLLFYSFFIGFSNRFVDIVYDGEIIEGDLFKKYLDEIKSISKPEVPVEERVVENLDVEVLYDAEANLELLKEIRFARNLILKSSNDIQEIYSFLLLSDVRRRNGQEFLPKISLGDDIYNLNEIKKLGNEIRRTNKVDKRDYIVKKEKITDRRINLESVANTDIEITLQWLGSYSDPETGFWRCTRPERHKNGDNNPSLKIIDGKIRCYRCDFEPIDSLRLVIDTENISTDDAVKILREITQ